MKSQLTLVISIALLVSSGQLYAVEKLTPVTDDEQASQEPSQITNNTRVVKKYKTKGRTSTTSKYSDAEESIEQNKPFNKTTSIEKGNNVANTAGSAKPSKALLPLVAIDQKPPPSVSPEGQWLNEGFTWIDDWFIDKEVKPWQKAKLAEPAMLPGGVAPVMKKFSSKIYISKAATLGGDGVAGGGCGCK